MVIISQAGRKRSAERTLADPSMLSLLALGEESGGPIDVKLIETP
jgi:hypothetical protein